MIILKLIIALTNMKFVANPNKFYFKWNEKQQLGMMNHFYQFIINSKDTLKTLVLVHQMKG